MKYPKLVIANAQVLGNTGKVRLTFVGQPQSNIAIKPLGVLTGRLDPLVRMIVETSPSMLIGATLSVEDSNLNDVPVKGVINSFKAGDRYQLTAINSKVVNAEINPETNAPYKVGEFAVTDTDGISINGNINIVLAEDVTMNIEQTITQQVVAMHLSSRKTKAVTTRASATTNVDEPIVDEHVETIDDDINGHVEGKKDDKKSDKKDQQTA